LVYDGADRQEVCGRSSTLPVFPFVSCLCDDCVSLYVRKPTLDISYIVYRPSSRPSLPGIIRPCSGRRTAIWPRAFVDDFLGVGTKRSWTCVNPVSVLSCPPFFGGRKRIRCLDLPTFRRSLSVILRLRLFLPIRDGRSRLLRFGPCFRQNRQLWVPSVASQSTDVFYQLSSPLRGHSQRPRRCTFLPNVPLPPQAPTFTEPLPEDLMSTWRTISVPCQSTRRNDRRAYDQFRFSYKDGEIWNSCLEVAQTKTVHGQVCDAYEMHLARHFQFQY
jgi:hypothetical protein